MMAAFSLPSCLFLLLFAAVLPAQNRLSTPLEILTFMEASGTDYQVEQLYGTVAPRTAPVLPHGAFILDVDGVEHTLEYKELWTCTAQQNFDKARSELNVEKPNYPKIRRFYQKVRAEFPSHAQLYTLIGETYLEQNQPDIATLWLDSAIALNPIDYLARWHLAEIYARKEQWDSAATAITVAHIYNRNNPRLLLRLQEIYAKSNRQYIRDWGFEPQCRNYQDSSTIVIVADGIWLTYAMYKAVWEYEPDYFYIKQRQAVTDYLFHQEMEAAIGTFMTFSALRKEDKRNFPAMMALENALDHSMVEEYIFYEILLRERPTIANHTTDVFLRRLLQYIFTVRGKSYKN